MDLETAMKSGRRVKEIQSAKALDTKSRLELHL